MLSHCLCAVRPLLPTRAGVCLLMSDLEPLKPSNTGWLVADAIDDTFAFGWARTETDPALLALLEDPQWQPFVVFPAEYADPGRVVRAVHAADLHPVADAKRPLFVLLDGTWSEARKMFRKSPCLDALPVLDLSTAQKSMYQLRRSCRDDRCCTSEVVGRCLSLAGEPDAQPLLDAYLAVFTHHYLRARQQLPVDWDGEAHRLLRELGAVSRPRAAGGR